MERNDNNVSVGNSGNSPNSSSTTHGIIHNTSAGIDMQVRIKYNLAEINELTDYCYLKMINIELICAIA